MRECKNCNVKVADYQQNCPLCGAYTSVIEGEEQGYTVKFAPYPAAQKKPKQQVVKNIFWALTALLFIASLMVGLLATKMSVFYIAATTLFFAWIAVLRFVFYKTNLRAILVGDTFALLLLGLLVCLHFGRIDIAVSYLFPATLFAANCTFMMIVFISGKWYRYAYQAFVVSILEMILFAVIAGLGYNLICGAVAGCLGLVTILFSLVFGRSVLLEEIKKRWFM